MVHRFEFSIQGAPNLQSLPFGLPVPVVVPARGWGHDATDTGLAYAPVSQAHGHHHSVQCFASLHRSAARFCTTPGGL